MNPFNPMGLPKEGGKMEVGDDNFNPDLFAIKQEAGLDNDVKHENMGDAGAMDDLAEIDPAFWLLSQVKVHFFSCSRKSIL